MITPTTFAPDHLMDPRPVLARAITTGSIVVAGVEPDQLTNPTPCTDMNVRALLTRLAHPSCSPILLTHLAGVLDRVAALGNGTDPHSPKPSRFLSTLPLSIASSRGTAETHMADPGTAGADRAAGATTPSHRDEHVQPQAKTGCSMSATRLSALGRPSMQIQRN